MKTKKRFTILFAAIFLALTAAAFAACGKTPVITADENTVFITVTEKQTSGKSLKAYMDELQKKRKLSYTIKDGMITSVNGKQNTANSYWILYTSDSENANAQWGVFQHEGKRYGSATLGAEQLIIKQNCVYIWAYQSFAF